MDQIEKFLRKLDKKTALIIGELLMRIVKGELKGLDIEKLKGHKDLYRLRKGKIRIIFQQFNDRHIPVFIEYRGKVYKGL